MSMEKANILNFYPRPCSQTFYENEIFIFKCSVYDYVVDNIYQCAKVGYNSSAGLLAACVKYYVFVIAVLASYLVVLFAS